MDLIEVVVELLLELIFEGSTAYINNKKLPKLIKYLLIIFISLLLILAVVILLIIGSA